MAHAEVIPAGGSAAATASVTAVYEYWWTIGHGGSKPEHRHLLEGRAKPDLWRRLDDIAARVYLYFPISGGLADAGDRGQREVPEPGGASVGLDREGRR